MSDGAYREPVPFGHFRPRYAPGRPFPPYRFIPGHAPHPITHPDGHSHGRAEPVFAPLTEGNWRESEDYLFGVDLYNHAYWWEAHEAWEGLWRVSPEPVAGFLQGLIQCSGALIKAHVADAGGTRRLSERGRAKMRESFENRSGSCEVFLGIDVPEHLARWDRYFAVAIRRAEGEKIDDEVNPLIILRV